MNVRARNDTPAVAVPTDDEDFVSEVLPAFHLLPAEAFIDAVVEAGDIKFLAVLTKSAAQQAAALQRRKRGRRPGVNVRSRQFKRDRHIYFEVERLRRDGICSTKAISYVAEAFRLDDSRVRKILGKFKIDVTSHLEMYTALLIEHGKIKAPK